MFTPAPPTAADRLLPVYAHEAELLEAMRHHQVVVVQGPTGCGKTTQIPQMLLRAGVTNRVIGVTQPRRIAAVSVAWRIAEEQVVPVGAEVGYKIRFDDRTSPATRVQIMTDGILLQEAHFDAEFSRYGVIVVDEAHERSLNIDFLLGLLHQLLRRRKDLHVIISSATLDPVRFVRFFEDSVGAVPVVAIDARPFPVEVVYRPLYSDAPDDLADAVAKEVSAIHKSGHPGHVLAFMSGEDSIRRCGVTISRMHLGRDLLVMPLYGAMNREDQERVFEPMHGLRKVIIATNIAETSITIDDTRFVIDSGIAKVPRVATRTGITSLREEGISRASADQRLGRAGRTAPGKCIRLYSQQDYAQRPEFTDEEILRLDLAEVVLRLVDLGVHDVEEFPFPTPPPRSRLRAAVETLQAMGAIDARRGLTEVGRRMVPFPLTPQLARMVVEAGMRFQDVVDEVLLAAAWLSTRSPLQYPAGHEDAARKAHAAFAHPLGDVVTSVRIYRAWERSAAPGDLEGADAFCRKHYLEPTAMAFIKSAHSQLADIAERLGMLRVSGGDPIGLVRSVAAGFASNILACHGRWFEGPGQEKINLHPASSLYGQTPKFVVAAELVISTRAYARQVSIVKAAWVAELRPDLAERWRIAADRGVQAATPPPPDTPRTLKLGNVTLEVDARKGKPRVEIFAEDIQKLAGIGPADLPDGAARYQARVVVGPFAFATGTPLGALLAILPHLPLPAPDANLRCSVPEGALLELDLNQHTLARHLPHLLEPMLPGHGKRPGWLMLVANGGGGYWFEVGLDWREVLETTVVSLDDLVGSLEEDDALWPVVHAQAEDVRGKLHVVNEAMAAARRGRRAG